MITKRARKTIAAEISANGFGLHSGQPVEMIIKPSQKAKGFVFYRSDLQLSVGAKLECVTNTNRHTCIGLEKSYACTIEHVLSGLVAHGITDAEIVISAAECPILDGSSLYYSEQIAVIGVTQIDGEYPVFTPHSTILFSDPVTGGQYKLIPTTHYSSKATILREGSPLHGCTATLTHLDEYSDSIAPSRTFVLYSDLLKLAAHGLVKGGAIETASVLFDIPAEQKDINALLSHMGLSEELNWTKEMLSPRSTDEPARHKLLDLLGDSALLEMDICARVECINPSHSSNIAFFRYLKSIIDAC